MRHSSTVQAISQLEAERLRIYAATSSRFLTDTEVARLETIREALARRWQQRRAEQATVRVRA